MYFWVVVSCKKKLNHVVVCWFGLVLLDVHECVATFYTLDGERSISLVVSIAWSTLSLFHSLLQSRSYRCWRVISDISTLNWLTHRMSMFLMMLRMIQRLMANCIKDFYVFKIKLQLAEKRRTKFDQLWIPILHREVINGEMVGNSEFILSEFSPCCNDCFNSSSSFM